MFTVVAKFSKNSKLLLTNSSEIENEVDTNFRIMIILLLHPRKCVSKISKIFSPEHFQPLQTLFHNNCKDFQSYSNV